MVTEKRDKEQGYKDNLSSSLTLLHFAFFSIAAYAVLAWLHPLSNVSHWLFSWGRLSRGSMGIWALQMALFLGVMGAYIVANLRLVPSISANASKRANPKTVIWLGWLMMNTVLLFSYPGESLDIFDYLFRGRMFSEYNVSPLQFSPSYIENKPFSRYVVWFQWVDAYGPLWEYISAGVAIVVRAFNPALHSVVITDTSCTEQAELCQYLIRYITGYRLLSIAAAAGCAWLIQSIADRHATITSRPASIAPTTAWLWNPLLLVSTAIGGHNETLALLPILIAVWLFQRKRFFAGLMALLLAAHFKITLLVLLPVFCLWLLLALGWRAAVLRIGFALLLILPISWLLYAPLGGWGTLVRNLYERSQLATNSITQLVSLFLQTTLNMHKYDVNIPLSKGVQALFVAIGGGWLIREWRLRVVVPDDAFLFKLLFGISMIYLCVGSFWFQPWYVLGALAFASLQLTTARTTDALGAWVLACALAFGAIIASLTADTLNARNPAFSVGIITIIAVFIQFTPLIFGFWILNFGLRIARPKISMRNLKFIKR
jgi:hypothetical protein